MEYPSLFALRNSATLRFALVCSLLLLLAVRLEPFMGPLNRATANLTGKVLAAGGLSAVVVGDIITVGTFPARIVTECTSLYAIILLCSFLISMSLSWRQRLSGIAIGAFLLTVVNIVRIAFVSAIGSTHPELFEAIHVYLGQIVMLVLLLGWCLFWAGKAGKGQISGYGGMDFIVRCMLWGSLLVIPWVFLNVSYMRFLDGIVSLLFSLTGVRLVIPHQHSIYYQTFNLVLFSALILSERALSVSKRIQWLVNGTLLLVGFHLLFRVCNVLITAFGWDRAFLWSESLVVIADYLLPVFLWLSASRRGELVGAKELTS